MDLTYALTPFAAWFIAGSLKFLINSIKIKKSAVGLIGYGGLPSNHSAIVSSIATLIALREGIDHPAFGVAVALAFIVILDASSLRRRIGEHAKVINQLLNNDNNLKKIHMPLRERIGHTPIEVFAGVITGAVVASLINNVQ